MEQDQRPHHSFHHAPSLGKAPAGIQGLLDGCNASGEDPSRWAQENQERLLYFSLTQQDVKSKKQPSEVQFSWDTSPSTCVCDILLINTSCYEGLSDTPTIQV